MTLLRPAASLLLAVGILLSAPACTSSGSARSAAQMPLVPPAHVSDEAFAKTLAGVLADGERSEERQKLVLGVVRRQLIHAKERYERGADERATQSVLGALYLLRRGEQSPLVFDDETEKALDGAIARLSARGDIGRVKVLYAWRSLTATAAEKKEIQVHVGALDRFRTETLTGRMIERAGDAERTAVSMAMLAPEHIEEAVQSVDAWIALGIHHNQLYQKTRKRPSPEESIEIARSLGSGAATLAALMLRYGDIERAVQVLLGTTARRVTEPQFFAALKAVEKSDDARSWRNLYDALATEVEDRIGGEIGIDGDLYAAARFAVLVEAHRRDLKHVGTGVELSRSLIDLGMSEAVPLVMERTLDEDASPADVVQGIRAVSRAIIADSSDGDVDAASRTIAASSSFLDKAKGLLPDRGGAAAIAELRYSMASILLEGGHVDQAEKLLTVAIGESPKWSGHLMRAQLRRQRKAYDEALKDVVTVVKTAGVDAVDVTDARLLEYEIARDRGATDVAKEALAAALATITPAVEQRRAGVPRARALAALGRVLQAYGDREGARKAFERAMEAVPGDRDLVGALMLQAASAGLALDDREGVKMALKRGLDAGAPQEDLVYGAVWLMLAEKSAGARHDEAAFEILESAAKQSTWVGRLAAWAGGSLSDEALAKKASSEESRIEATFYVAMARRARGTPSDDALRTVASSPLLQSNEVKIARDLLAPRPSFGVPKNVKIP